MTMAEFKSPKNTSRREAQLRIQSPPTAFNRPLPLTTAFEIEVKGPV